MNDGEPARPEGLFHAATVLIRQNRPAEAAARFSQLLALQPDHIATLNALGSVLQLMNRAAEAVPLFERAQRLAPRDPQAPFRLGCALFEADRPAEATELLTRATQLAPMNARAFTKLGLAHYACDRIAEAERAFGRALALAPNDAETYYGIGCCLQALGRFASARHAFDRALTLVPDHPGYWNAYLQSETIRPGDPALAHLEAMAAADAGYPGRDRAYAHFNLAKAYDDLGRWDTAFAEYRTANALMRAETDYDEGRELAQLNRMAEIFTPDFLRRWSGRGNASELPIFILGMPRSGTSLVEQMLASHPDVYGAGELPDLAQIFVATGTDLRQSPERWVETVAERYLSGLRRRAPKVRRITDKMPGNFPYVGVIHLALPGAKILHVRRDPLDTCLSCYTKPFTGNLPYSYDLAELGRYWRAYDALMAHWRAVLPEGAMLELRYEELIGDFPGVAQRILAFCGLDWNPACLDFHRTQRMVRTASLAQVRQPLYRHAIGHAQAYRSHLRPLIDALAAPDAVRPAGER